MEGDYFSMYKCNQCGSNFYSTVDVANHVEAKHPDSNPGDFALVQYRCKVCGYLFNHRIDCRNHAMREHGIQRMDCLEVRMEEESSKVPENVR